MSTNLKEDKKIRLAFIFQLVFICFFSLAFESKAACTYAGANTSTYTYTAANLSSSATINMLGQWTCTNGSAPTISPRICVRGVFAGNTSQVGGSSLPYTLSATVGGGNTAPQAISGTWYGPAATVATNGVLSSSIKVTVPANTANVLPAGTYTATVVFSFDMQAVSSGCDGGGGWDSGTYSYTFKYVIPPSCSLLSTGTVDFGNIAQVGISTSNYDANATITAICNPNTPFTIYLSDGNNRLPGGYRQMNNGMNFLPYQLYKDPNYSSVWDNTGGTSTTGGSGGVSSAGTGTNQIFNVYGRIPQGSVIPGVTGTYNDNIIVTVSY